jgi:hypothetical protein
VTSRLRSTTGIYILNEEAVRLWQSTASIWDITSRSKYKHHTSREAIENWLHPRNMKEEEEGFCFSKL